MKLMKFVKAVVSKLKGALCLPPRAVHALESKDDQSSCRDCQDDALPESGSDTATLQLPAVHCINTATTVDSSVTVQVVTSSGLKSDQVCSFAGGAQQSTDSAEDVRCATQSASESSGSSPELTKCSGPGTSFGTMDLDPSCSSSAASAGTEAHQLQLPAPVERILASAAKAPQPEDEASKQVLEGKLSHLWVAAYKTPCTSLKGKQWKAMGWQGQDPTSDFRSCGHLGLDCLLYLADNHEGVFQRLLHKTDSNVCPSDRKKLKSDDYYPFAVAGINVAHMLLEVLGQRSAPQQSEKQRVGSSLVQLLEEEENAFEELFVAAFECLDQEWMRQGASYLQFGQVLKAVKSRLESCLAGKGAGRLARLGSCWMGAAPRLTVALVKHRLTRP